MTELKVEGMTCGHCAATVKTAVEAAAPGAAPEVDLPAKTVRVADGVDLDAVRAAIRNAGYETV
jgi:copper chaperone